jgi:hypothetical protein
MELEIRTVTFHYCKKNYHGVRLGFLQIQNYAKSVACVVMHKSMKM